MLENKLFEALLDVIPFKAYAVDINTFEVVYANKKMRENMYAPQETYCWEQVFGQEEICSWCSIIDLQVKQHQIQIKEKHIIEFFDETDDKWLKSYDELMSWPDGREVKYSILVDITDQKEIQGSMIKSHATLAMKNKQMIETNKKLQITKLRLQQSVNEFEQLLNSTMDGVLVFENGFCKDINNQALKILKVKNKEELIGKSLLDFVSKDSKEIIRNNEDIYDKAIECNLLRSDNTYFPALIQNSSLQSRGLVVTSFIDLTELKEKDKLIIEQNKMLALGDMMTNISHHWRQPLSVISTAASGIKLEKDMDTLTDCKFKSYLNKIMENSNNLSKTIDSFSDLVLQKNELSKVSLEEFTCKIIDILTPTLNHSKIDIINNIDTSSNTNILIPTNEVSQVIMNIVSNSKDALLKNKVSNQCIKFEVQKNKETVVLIIQDNGGGIDLEIIDRVFEPYFTTKHKSHGTGLSLNLCKKIMHDLKGDIYFKNTKDGVNFYLEFSL